MWAAHSDFPAVLSVLCLCVFECVFLLSPLLEHPPTHTHTQRPRHTRHANSICCIQSTCQSLTPHPAPLNPPMARLSIHPPIHLSIYPSVRSSIHPPNSLGEGVWRTRTTALHEFSVTPKHFDYDYPGLSLLLSIALLWTVSI